MKKFILLLFGLSLSVIGASAMNLREAYNALSNLPNVSQVAKDSTSITINNVERYDGRIMVSQASGLDKTEIFNTGNATYDILNQIPLTSMINGGNNGYVAAFVYSAPNEVGLNDLLVVTMSGWHGDVTYVYLTNVEDADKTAVVNAKFVMEGSSLSLTPQSDNFLSFEINGK